MNVSFRNHGSIETVQHSEREFPDLIRGDWLKISKVWKSGLALVI